MKMLRRAESGGVFALPRRQTESNILGKAPFVRWTHVSRCTSKQRRRSLMEGVLSCLGESHLHKESLRWSMTPILSG